MLPQIDGSASISRSRSEGPATQNQFNEDGQPLQFTGDIESETTTRSVGINASQMLFDMSRFTALRTQKALSRASDFQLAPLSNNLITRNSAAYFTVLFDTETLPATAAAQPHPH